MTEQSNTQANCECLDKCSAAKKERMPFYSYVRQNEAPNLMLTLSRHMIKTEKLWGPPYTYTGYCAAGGASACSPHEHKHQSGKQYGQKARFNKKRTHVKAHWRL